jgi:hypothetical protein
MLRLLQVATTALPEDVALLVDEEPLNSLRHVGFLFVAADGCGPADAQAAGRPDLPLLAKDGHLEGPVLRERDDGYELPRDGVRLPVEAHGRRFGWLEAVPRPDAGVSLERRKLAVALAGVLGLALATEGAGRS